MKRLTVLLVSALVLALALAACPAPTPATPTVGPGVPQYTPVVYTDQSKPITVSTGMQFIVELDSNPTTGFMWTATFDARVLSQVSQDYRPDPATPGLVGSGGKDRFTFQAMAAGTTDLAFTYHRANETTYAQSKIFKITVK